MGIIIGGMKNVQLEECEGQNAGTRDVVDTAGHASSGVQYHKLTATRGPGFAIRNRR